MRALGFQWHVSLSLFLSVFRKVKIKFISLDESHIQMAFEKKQTTKQMKIHVIITEQTAGLAY